MDDDKYDLTMLCLYDIDRLGNKENKEHNILALYPIISDEADHGLSLGNIYDIKKFTYEKRCYRRLSLNDIGYAVLTVNAYTVRYLYDYLKPWNTLVNYNYINIVHTKYDTRDMDMKEVNLFKLKYLKNQIFKFLRIKTMYKSMRLLYCSKSKKFIIVNCNHTELMNLLIGVEIKQADNNIDDVVILDLDDNKHSINMSDYLNFIKQELFIPDYNLIDASSYKLFINLFCIETYAELKSFVSDLYKIHSELIK